MRSEPVYVDEVDGAIVVSTHRRGAFGLEFLIEVDGEPGTRIDDTHWLLPGVDGSDQHAELKGKFWEVFPTLVVSGQEVRTGPKLPWWLIALAVLPGLMCAPFDAPFGWTSFIVGVVTLLANQLALREAPTMNQRAVRVVVQGFIGFAFWLMLVLPTMSR